MNMTDDFHCFRADPQAHWHSIASVLESDAAAWDWALANIERWLSQRSLHPAPLLEWRQCLLESRDQAPLRKTLLETLRNLPADSHQEQLRSCAPFVGGPFRSAKPAAVLAP